MSMNFYALCSYSCRQDLCETLQKVFVFWIPPLGSKSHSLKFGSQALNSRCPSLNSRSYNLDYGSHFLDSNPTKYQIPDPMPSGSYFLGYRSHFLDSGFQSLDSGFHSLGSRSHSLDSGFHSLWFRITNRAS